MSSNANDDDVDTISSKWFNGQLISSFLGTILIFIILLFFIVNIKKSPVLNKKLPPSNKRNVFRLKLCIYLTISCLIFNFISCVLWCLLNHNLLLKNTKFKCQMVSETTFISYLLGKLSLHTILGQFF